MVQKIKGFFMKFLSIFIISMMALFWTTDYEMGGVGVNGYISLALWLILVVVAIKISERGAVAASVLFYIIVSTIKYGMTIQIIWSIIFLVIIIFGLQIITRK